VAHIATISSKGQIVIPAEIREELRLKAGARVAVKKVGGEIIITPNPFDALLALRGCLSHVEEDVEAWWMAEKRLGREREEVKYREML
jgi:AbrB family looped-hinge helix DNA binding protein